LSYPDDGLISTVFGNQKILTSSGKLAVCLGPFQTSEGFNSGNIPLLKDYPGLTFRGIAWMYFLLSCFN
jgi:hypothetical protein